MCLQVFNTNIKKKGQIPNSWEFDLFSSNLAAKTKFTGAAIPDLQSGIHEP
jgi:hypothetical protein